MPETTGYKMKITAVFPNGSEHAVFSDGTKLTAGAAVPNSATVEFEVVQMNGESYVLRAADQFLHWTSGDNTQKSDDLDGLNETFDPSLNFLTIKLGDASGLQSTTWDTSAIPTLYEVIGNGSNGSPFNFTLRENDDNWIAGDPGMKFFDTNWDGNGCRTSFFRVELIEPATPDGIDTIVDVTDTIEKAKLGKATLDEINAVADRVLIFDMTGRRVRRVAPGSVYIVAGRRMVW